MLYVCGFILDKERKRCLLVRKGAEGKIPAHMRGKWNGIGGKVSPGEAYIAAMSRECMEETRIAINPEDWEKVARYDDPCNVCLFYAYFTDLLDALPIPQYTDVGEPLAIKSISPLALTTRREQLVPNLLWLLPYIQWWDGNHYLQFSSHLPQ